MATAPRTGAVGAFGAQGGDKIGLRGGGPLGAHFPNPPPLPPFVAMPGEGVWEGAHGGGGGGESVGTPTYIPQNDPHDVLTILNIHKWGKFFQNFFPPLRMGYKQTKLALGIGSPFSQPPDHPGAPPPPLRASFWSPSQIGGA